MHLCPRLGQPGIRFTTKYKWYLYINLAAALFLVGLQLKNSATLTYMLEMTKDQNAWVDVTQFMCHNYTVNPQCTRCVTGVPCEYKDEKDFRLIVLAFNRDYSLKKCLDRVKHLQMDGDSLSVEIWIDIDQNGRLHLPTYRTATAFAAEFTNGQVCIHVQNVHAFIANQWIYSYRPRPKTKEISLIVEDDVDISMYAYRWLKKVNHSFSNQEEVYSYSLQMENVITQSLDSKIQRPVVAPPTESIFLHVVFGTWGFSPKPKFWRKFQDWYTKVRQDDSIKPYMENFKATNWYKNFEKYGTQESMAHEMWMIYYVLNHRRKMYCLYSNLVSMTGREDVLLSAHRAEQGLHYSGQGVQNKTSLLLSSWDKKYEQFSSHPYAMDSFGNEVKHFED
jgi:hypothetical protein